MFLSKYEESNLLDSWGPIYQDIKYSPKELYRTSGAGAGEIAPWLRALVSLAVDQVWGSSTHMVAHKSVELQVPKVHWLLLNTGHKARMWYICTHAHKTLIYINIFKIKQESQVSTQGVYWDL